MSGEQSDQKGASVHGTAERGGSVGEDVRRHQVHYIQQMMYDPTTQQPIGVVPVPISIPILEAAAAMQASRLQQQQAREKVAAEKRRERERQAMEKKVRENLRREALKSRLTLLSAPEVCYNAGNHSADVYWMGVSEEDEQEVTSEDGDDEKNSEAAVVYHLTMQEGEVRKEVYRGPDCEYVVNELLPGHTYTFSLIACLNDVYGSSSPPYNLAVPPEPPNRPAAPRMATKSKTAITLRWTASADNGSPLDQYKLEWDQCGGEIAEVYSGKDKQYKMQHKFPPGAVARFRVSAHNQAGWSESSDWLVYEIHVTASVPAAPTSPSLVAATINSLSLSWEEPESKGAPITSYTLQMDDQDSGYGFKPVYQGEGREHTCSDLSRVTQYSFRVAATNSKGTGPFSSPSVFSTLPDRPGPPTDLGLSGKSHPTSFTITWSPPRDTGGSDISSYRLLLDDGAGGEMVEVYHGSELTYLAQGLHPGRTYCCKVSSTSVGGEGSWSSVAQLTTPPIAPSCPLQLSLCGKVTATHATLQWDKPEFDGGASVISYTVQGKVIGEEEWVVFGTVANPEAFSTQAQQSFSITVSSLAPGTEYEFRVRCANKVGSSPPSYTCQCLTAPGAPDPPAGLKLVSVSAITAVLSWQPPLDHGTPVTGYQLEHWLDTTDTQTLHKQQSVTTLQATVRGLSPASMYWCRLRAGSAAGHSVWSEPLSFSTTPSTPGPPRHLSVLTRTADSLLLVWGSPLTHGSPVTSYILETAGRQETMTLSSNETQFTITDLQPSTNYKFRLQAENIVGKGPFTPYVTSSTLPLPPSPPSLTLLSCSSNSLKLSWSEKTKGKSSSATSGLSYTLQMAAREGSSHYSTLYRGTSLGYKVQKLRPNISHSFRIAASSESGQGVWSTPVVFMTTPNAPPPPAGLLLRLMSASECLVSWEGMEGENMSYEVQYRKTNLSSLDYRQVYSDVKTSCVVPAASPGSSCEARVRAMQKVTVNGREEQLFSFFSSSVTCETPLPAEKEPVQDTSLDEAVEDSSNKQRQDSLALLRSPKCISAVLMIVIVSVGVLMALLMAQFIN